MVLKHTNIFVALALNLIQIAQYASSEHILPCNVSLVKTGCGAHQLCNETTSQCECLEGFMFYENECETPHEYASHFSITAPVVTIFALVLLVSALVLVIRKYSLVDYVRQKIIQRRNNDIMYEDVMIGNDDPPLSP